MDASSDEAREIDEARELRAARNQSLFRAVNEQIRKVNESFAELTGPGTIACECYDVRCIEMIQISWDTYEQVRSQPRHFAVRPGHLLTEVERVVEETDAYLVVEKVHVAAAVAEALDPRSA